MSIEGGTGGNLGPGSAVVAVLAVHHTSESGINPLIKILLPLAYRGEYNSALFWGGGVSPHFLDITLILHLVVLFITIN